ncbi:efflux transporter outer membrane subunit [Pseudomonas juntendi]|uniref:Efflux transporter outer membrane subunit n=1 Tax=Pseudomonas juntendi TaxID=2666183 RepID=A0A7W2JH26_9PSED|nr:efflux transporter outer membrane subunit [Pseudomonas juntendi]MBA6058769.1 efflux transporter outer membrane subunit [Pseudomonas juntendi]MBA6126002.1 efflux transporter outer membrane subunit [Pseudomonas juntendi]
MVMGNLAISLALACALTGCSLAPTYQRPEAPVPAQWGNATGQQGQAVAQLDWHAFIVDPTLRQLIGTALGNNRSLRQALLDIEQARALYGIRRADRVPGLNAGASANRQHLPSDLSSDGREGVNSTYQVGLSLPEYEIDLFGRVKSLSDAALEQYLATEEVSRAAHIALIAEVSQAYLTLDGAERRLALTRQTLGSRKDSLALVGQRRTVGTATALDHQEALGLVEQSRAQLESILREQQQAYNALVLLLGSASAANVIPAERPEAPMVLPDIAPGTPSALIERRPDILAAEHRLRARNADIGAARAAFFPRISLTGSFGTSSAQMSGLFEGGSRSWGFMPQLSLPLFDAGRNKAALSLSEARKDSAVAAYESTIQTAFREVADALAASDTLRREEIARQALAETSRVSLALAKARYEGGVDSHLRYLDAQRNTYLNEAAAIEASIERQKSLVDLFRALGGGWSTRG